MIATHVIGGLGNQMFQLAAGKALALKLGVELVLDDRYWDKPRAARFGLHNYAHNIRAAPRHGLPAMKYEGALTYMKRKLQSSAWKVYENDRLQFDPAFSQLGDGTWLKGYFQSELYFSDYADEIHDMFRLARDPCDETQTVLRSMEKCLPVALHIRRGDMVNNTKNLAVHGTPSLNYFHAAAAYVAERTGEQPTFFVFSDEPNWVSENLTLDHPMLIISHNGPERSHEDIFLMSRFHHNIIANSTFSWWGAWLNPNPEKLVVCPDKWFAAPELQQHSLIPVRWVELQSQ